MGRFYEMLNLMLWKNVHIVKNNKFQLIVSIILPLILEMIAIALRLKSEIKYDGVLLYEKINLEKTFKQYLDKIERRRTSIEKHVPRPYYSVYCPRLIIAVAAANLTEYEPIYQPVLDATAQFGVEGKMFNDCKKLAKEMQENFFLLGICFKERPHQMDLNYKFILASEYRDYNDTFVSNFWILGESEKLQLESEHVLKYGTIGGTGAVREGVVFIQKIIGEAHMRLFEKNFPYEQIHLARLPNFHRIYDSLTEERSSSIILIILLCYLFPSVFIISLLIDEKESGIRNLLVVRGVSVMVQLLAWSIVFWFLTAFISLNTAIVFKIGWLNGEPILSMTSFAFLLIFLLGYCVANATFCVMVSSVCSSKYKAIPFLTLCWLLGLSMHLYSSYGNPFAKYYGFKLFFLPNAMTANFLSYIYSLDKHNVRTSLRSLIYFGYKSETFYTLIASGVVFFFLACVLDKFKPGLYGTPLNLCKLLRQNARYAGRRWAKKWPLIGRRNSPIPLRTIRSTLTSDNKFSFIAEPVINIFEMSKAFKTQSLFKKFSFTILEQELIVCLGANGSGKSVLSLILGGLMSFDEGVVEIHGIDMRTYKKVAVDGVSIALGSNLLMPDLTFMEQLFFFCRLNGTYQQYSWSMSEHLLNDLKMGRYANVLTKHVDLVSKNTLALMCAFAGNKPIIILDSFDTILQGKSGWQLSRFILNRKGKRTIFLTTCSTSVASLMASRILLLQTEHLTIHGPIDSLKESFGNGIVLSCTKSRIFNEELYSSIVKRHVPEAVAENVVNSSELVYFIGLEHVTKMPDLLNELEEKRKILALDNFFIRQPSLDDIFRGLKEQNISAKTFEYTPSDADKTVIDKMLESAAIEVGQKSEKYEAKMQTLRLLKNTKPTTGLKLLVLRVEALLRKQYYVHAVNKFTLIFYLLIPLIICLHSLILSKIYVSKLSVTERQLTPNHYDKIFTIVSSSRKLPVDRRDIIYAYHRQWMELQGETRFYFEDIKHESIIELVSQKHISRKMEFLYMGMHVTRSSIIARFHSNFLHTAQTSLNLVHNAIFGTFVNDFRPRIQVSLEILTPELNVMQSEVNSIRFLSFCLALGLWFVFGLSTTGINFGRNSFSTEQHIKGLLGSAFWITSILVTFIKLLIIVPILLIFLIFSEYGVLMTSWNIGIVILLMVLGAFYFRCIKILMFILFYEIEKKNIISIFATIVGIIVFQYNNSISNIEDSFNFWYILLPLNFISRLFFIGFILESTAVMCQTDAIYNVVVYAENCNALPPCCDFHANLMKFYGNLFYFALFVSFFIAMGIFCSRFYRVVMQCSFRKTPLQKPMHLRSETSGGLVQEEQEAIDSVDSKSQTLTFNHHVPVLNNIPVLLDSVGKRSRQQDIVDDVSFVVERGECFSLLGPPGNEKHMLLRLIAGDTRPSYGRTFLYGESAAPKLLHKNKTTLGYCLLDMGRVHLFKVGQYMEIYALSLGFPRRNVRDMCKKLAFYMEILSDYDKLIATVCTSTKHRLTFVMAFLGCPQITVMEVRLVEVDYSGKDLMMNLLSWYLNQGGTTIMSVFKPATGVLFGTRLGIFINRRFRTIGSLGSMCEKHANGYLVVAKIIFKIPEEGRINLNLDHLNANAAILYCSFIESQFHTAILKAQYKFFIEYFIPYNDTTFARIFNTLEENKKMLKINDYYITNNTIHLVYEKMKEAFKYGHN